MASGDATFLIGESPEYSMKMLKMRQGTSVKSFRLRSFDLPGRYGGQCRPNEPTFELLDTGFDCDM